MKKEIRIVKIKDETLKKGFHAKICIESCEKCPYIPKFVVECSKPIRLEEIVEKPILVLSVSQLGFLALTRDGVIENWYLEIYGDKWRKISEEKLEEALKRFYAGGKNFYEHYGITREEIKVFLGSK